MAFDDAAWDAHPDSTAVRVVRPLVRALQLVHPTRVEGVENLPTGPAILVGNHGMLGYESPVFFERVLHACGRMPVGLADRWFFRVPVLREAIVRLGGAYAAPRTACGRFAAARSWSAIPAALAKS